MEQQSTDCIACWIYREYDNDAVERLTVEADVPSTVADDDVREYIANNSDCWLVVGAIWFDDDNGWEASMSAVVDANVTSVRVDFN